MVIIRDPFLGQTNNSERKEDAGDYTDNVAEERCNEAINLRVVYYKLCAVVVHLYAPTSPNYSEEYPRQHQHGENGTQQEQVAGSSAQLGPRFRVQN